MIVTPALVKVLICITAVVAVSRFGVQLGLALAAGGSLLGLWMGLPLTNLGLSWLNAITREQTLSLLALVMLILWLSGLMKDSGQLQRIVEAFGRLVKSPRVAAVVMPAMIGLLPMPGGALFSAPMVAACCQLPERGKGEGEGALLTVINYWFRHHAELWWPLYPGVILALSLSGLPAWLFATCMFPLMLAHLTVGWIFLMPKAPKIEPPAATPESKARSLLGFLWQAAPVLIVVASLPVMTIAFSRAQAAGWHLPDFPGAPLLVGLLAACAWVVAVNRMGAAPVLAAMRHKETWSVPLLLVAVMGFKGILVDSGAVTAISREFVQLGIPTLALIVLLPFICGVVTGIGVGLVAASFPLITPLFPHGDMMQLMATAGLAFASGYLGQMISPIHLCLVVTKEYFSADYGPCYRRLALPCLGMAVCIAIWRLVVASL